VSVIAARRAPVSLRRCSAVLIALSAVVAATFASAPPARAAQSVVISGHGYGHGRGLSQYGSLGYAVDYGWNYAAILDHYYGGTTMGTVGNDPITVELLDSRGTSPAIIGGDIRVNGVPINAGAVRVHREAGNQFGLEIGTGCGGPWTSWGGPQASGLTLTSAAPATGANVLKVCQAGTIRGYRGALQVFEASGSLALVNLLPVEEYLMGVVPRESPASWGAAGGGKGLNALKAQAVAARSYALAGGWTSYAKTCDSTSCQVYQGVIAQASNGSLTSMENSYSNDAVAQTAGQVRVRGGAVMRTEFSSSSGGWTAGGTFPAVQDLGDGTASNPNRNWSVTVDGGVLAQRLGTPPITGVSVTQRNGLGVDGGRVLKVVVSTTGGQRTFTGSTFRSLAQLKSDWFSASVSGVSPQQASSFVRALYSDVLGRVPADSEVASWANGVAGGADRTAVARQFVFSSERWIGMIATAYQGALHRAPEPGGVQTWIGFLSTGASLNDLNAAVYGSEESVIVLGGGDNGQWVEGMYQGLLGRAAAPSERAYWTDVANHLGRRYVALNISSSVEARQGRLNGYYLQMLQRTVDPTGVQTWVPRMAGRGDFDVQTFIAGSTEYWDKSALRFP
jgi:SpoIID/LytB domain protein